MIYKKYFVEGKGQPGPGDPYPSHNTRLLDMEGTVDKLLTTEYVREALARLKGTLKEERNAGS